MLSPKDAPMIVDKVFDRNNTVYVKNVPKKGRGVFANTAFREGEVIERAPTWGFCNTDAELLDRTGLFQYYFVRHDRKLKKDPLTGYVVFGFISIVNHSFSPNAKIAWADEESGTWASIVAINDIRVDDEITHRYTNISAYPHSISFVE